MSKLPKVFCCKTCTLVIMKIYRNPFKSNIIITSLFLPFPSLKPSHVLPAYSHSNLWPLFSLIVTHIYLYMYTHYFQLHKYSCISLYNVTPHLCFRAERLVLDKKLVCSSLGRWFLPPLPSWVACSSLSRVELSLFPYQHVSWVILVQLTFRRAYQLDFMSVASDISKRQDVITNSHSSGS